MSVEVSLETPLAEALNAAIQPKLVEVGWSTGGVDDSALAEYIILMLVNGKTQDQIAAELSGDLLNLGPDDPGARDFSQWLFQQVEYLSGGDHAAGALASQTDGTSGSGQLEGTSSGQDAEMGDVAATGDSNVYAKLSYHSSQFLNLPQRTQRLTGIRPTGPKSMRNGTNRNRDKRMFSHLEKALDRSHDSALHRVRPHGGNERINTHARGTPTGPRAIQGRAGRPAMNRPGAVHGSPGTGLAANVMAMNPQQQMELYSMLEQQSRIMAQMFTPQQQQQMMMQNGGHGSTLNGGIGNAFPQQHQPGRSLFDRVQPNPQGHHAGNLKKGPQAVGGKQNGPTSTATSTTSAMDIELTPAPERPSADTACKFNLACTNKDCIFAHQSPAAPPGTAIDVSDVCSFGAACKNRKCTGRHPSPAQKIAHQTEQDCKFFPNCTNPRCPFRHPTMPLCRNGADCTTPNCKFTHVKTMCKFNPCLNPTCSFKHEEGQKRGKFDDKVWVAGEKEHVSERKFVDESEGVEELIVPGNPGTVNTTELVT
jgi:nuclear polyadenylated RNA-binding protein NAB2